MKNILKRILNLAGYRLIKKKYLKNFVHIGTVRNIDFYYLLKNVFSNEENIFIFDIGANAGQTAKKFRQYFPGAFIYCFEPVLNTYNRLLNNVQSDTNIYTYNLAMGSVEGEQQIFHREDSEWNSLVEKLNEKARTDGGQAEVISVDTVDNFVKTNGIKKIHLLKSDTEGFELEVILGAKE